MRRPGRLFIQILLVSVVLNFADWPYMDEIAEASPAGTLTELLGHKLSPAEKNTGRAHAVQVGFQLLLLGLHAIPLEPMATPEPQHAKALATAPRLLLSSLAAEIDRPPRLRSRS